MIKNKTLALERLFRHLLPKIPASTRVCIDITLKPGQEDIFLTNGISPYLPYSIRGWRAPNKQNGGAGVQVKR